MIQKPKDEKKTKGNISGWSMQHGFPNKAKLEEVPVKWMDRLSATEMERGCASEMEIEISSIHFCDTWSGYLFHIDRNSLKKKFRLEIWTFSFQICFWNKFLTSGSGQTENYANTRICVFSVWPLPEVENWFRKQIWNENVPLQGPYFEFSRSSLHQTPQSRPEPWTERLFLQFQFGRPCLIS